MTSSVVFTMTRQKKFAPALVAATFAFCACGFAQKTPHPSNRPPSKAVATHQAKPSPAVLATPKPPVILLNQPAEPATITLAAGQLSIKANNSSLSSILDQIAKQSGMTVDGMPGSGADQRIFGNYGPGDARKVLSEFLDGCGFNVIMLGKTPAGTPKTLSLSPRAPGGLPNPPAQPVAAQYQNYRENYMAHPTAYPPSPNDTPQPGMPQPRIRTPQEILQQLEQMRGRQQQQN